MNQLQINYLGSIKKQFKYYKMLGEKTFNQLNKDELFLQKNNESNSIAIIVNHLWGNMMSRWTNFITSDGEKDWRNRDLEFEDVIKSRIELLEKWNSGWQCLFEALNSINEKNFEDEIFIRNQGHTIIEAINRQLCHYSYHIGQIVFIGRLIKGNKWKSLSIPKVKSTEYNKEKFDKEKHKEHFTDELLKHEKKIKN